MKNLTANSTTQKQARIAGLLYLIIIICGLFAEGIVRGSLVVTGDAAATANNIVASGMLFRLGFLADLIMITSDVALALVLYLLFRPVDAGLALLAAFFRLAQAVTLAVNLLNHFAAGLVLNEADWLTAFDPDQLQSLAYFFLEMHNFGYYAGLVFFAIHCLLLGNLMCRSGWFPKILAAFLVVASISYAGGSLAVFLWPHYEPLISVSPLYVGPAIVAELSVCLWLLLKGTGGPGQQVRHR